MKPINTGSGCPYCVGFFRTTENFIKAAKLTHGSKYYYSNVRRIQVRSATRFATYYQWKSKYSGVSASELKRIKDLEAENSKLKRMYAELALENTAIKDVLSRKF